MSLASKLELNVSLTARICVRIWVRTFGENSSFHHFELIRKPWSVPNISLHEMFFFCSEIVECDTGAVPVKKFSLLYS